MNYGTEDFGKRIGRRLNEFLAKDGRGGEQISGDTNMIQNLGLTSLQGLEFVLDLCEEFNFDLPHEFNPFVNDQEKRGRTFEEMIDAVGTYLPIEEPAHGSK
jgi:acyl carrier protein